MSRSNLSKLFKKIGETFSALVTELVASWWFVFLYTMIMFTWVILHNLKILNIDPNLTYSSYFLCWLASVQASLIMQHENIKQDKHYLVAKKELAISEQSLAIDSSNKEVIKKMASKITSMYKKINKMQELIDQMEQESDGEDYHGTNGRHKDKRRRDN